MKSLLMVCFFTFLSANLLAADWPMWRCDSERSGTSLDPVVDNPVLLWERKLPPVRQAWPLDLKGRMGFDASYEPVAMGKLLFIGSPNDGTVTAYGIDTGEEKWKYFTDGPVRCALTCWNSKVYAGSDDGYLYCLDAKNGSLLWKFRGAPDDRPDRRQLGNGHLVSFWPVRGGAVVKDGVVYFGAGIWPIFGVFLYALDAETGKVKWSNKKLNYIENVRLDHDNLYDSGLSPQGHFIAIRDKLVVPCGRSMPAGLELATGKLIYYTQGAKAGDSRVTAHGDYAFVGKKGLVNLYDFRELGSKWACSGSTPPKGYKPEVDQKLYRPDLFESPDSRAIPYKKLEGCDALSVFEDGTAYGVRKGTYYAYDLKGAKAEEREIEKKYYMGKLAKLYPLVWEAPEIWKFKPTPGGKSCDVLIKAGDRLYGYAGKKLIAIENLKKDPKIAWKKNIPGIPSSMIAADGKLIVATKEGGLYCFGTGDSKAKTYKKETLALDPVKDDWTLKTSDIIQKTGAKEGYCLVLGLTNGRIIEELLKQTKLSIIAVDTDKAKIESLRRRFEAAGLYGSRVELFAGNPFEFPFPPYLANLIVSEEKDLPSETQVMKLFEHLRPYGGLLCLESAKKTDAEFAETKKVLMSENAKFKRKGDLLIISREGRLPNSGSWSHETADAAGTLFSKDNLVKAPLGILWYGDVLGSGKQLVYNLSLKKAVNGGRVYTLRETRAQITAHDAYTGRFLWKKKIGFLLARMVVMSDGVYVVGAGNCIVCDPETGKTLKTFSYKDTGATRAVNLRVDEDFILIACSDKDANWFQTKGYADASMLVCLDRETGAELWRRKAEHRFYKSGIAMGEGIVFCVDSMTYANAKKMDLKKVESKVFALDAATGKELWTQKGLFYRGGNDWVCYAPEFDAILAGRSSVASAYKAKSGDVIWKDKKIGRIPLIIRGKTFVNCAASVFDIETAKKIGQLPLGRQRYNFVGCNYLLGSKHLLIARDCSAAYCDIKDGKEYHLRNMRSGCTNNLVAADGLLNAPELATSCECNYPIYTSYAMLYMPEVAKWSGTKPMEMKAPPALPAKKFKESESTKKASQ